MAARLSMRREVLEWLIAARSGHGHFAAYGGGMEAGPGQVGGLQPPRPR